MTLRLKGKEIIPNDGSGKVDITDLPVGGYRRYETLECLSDVPYQGKVEKAYWVYTNPYSETLNSSLVDSIRCSSTGGCQSPDIGWQSSRGIYKSKKDKTYYGVVRLGRSTETTMEGLFTCVFEGDSNTPVSVNIFSECK